MNVDSRMPADHSPDVPVWDTFVRGAHWILAVSFALAYLTEDDRLTTHVWAGYAAGGIVLLRIVWGSSAPDTLGSAISCTPPARVCATCATCSTAGRSATLDTVLLGP